MPALHGLREGSHVVALGGVRGRVAWIRPGPEFRGTPHGGKTYVGIDVGTRDAHSIHPIEDVTEEPEQQSL